MLASISSFQPLSIGNYNQLNSLGNEQNPNKKIEGNKDNPTRESESSKVTQKAQIELTQEEQTKVQQLKLRDLEVKAHEQAHLGAAGALATGGASFSYTTGPDGLRYATGGEVGIDTAVVKGDPEATLRKADIIRRAALAPKSPSAQDQLVASQAIALAGEARTELIQQTKESTESVNETEKTDEVNEAETGNAEISEANTSSETSPATETGSIIDFSV